MSYCRFSTDDFRCDVYAYESDNGFTIHVAGSRFVGDCPKLDRKAFPNDHIDTETLVAKAKALHDWIMTCKREPITIPGAGESFHEADLAAFKARLLDLRTLGFRFPDEVLAAVDAEIAAQPIFGGA